ncbi:hypothetical protein ACGFNU_05665 [Spirillospora sp. NPDC048911]|uniref:hypothetical protein n=1 Tax=Spirillospora sp. NPDC048911 TaxID=3364527 RepID=UPI00371EEACE
MLAELPLSRWAEKRFGERAALVRRLVGESVAEAIESAQDAQGASGTGRQHPFGFTLMSRKYEALEGSFSEMPDVTTVRPKGSLHELTVVSGNLLFPFEFAKDRSVNVMKARIGGDAKISGLLKVLFNAFGPEPTVVQLALATTDEEENKRLAAVADSLARLPEDTTLVLVPYACNSQAGLLELWWGEAELLDEHGRLKWRHCEEIPFPRTSATGTGATSPIDLAATPRFDQGPMPRPPLNARPPLEVKNEEAFPPRTEAESPTQDAANDEGP